MPEPYLQEIVGDFVEKLKTYKYLYISIVVDGEIITKYYDLKVILHRTDSINQHKIIFNPELAGKKIYKVKGKDKAFVQFFTIGVVKQKEYWINNAIEFFKKDILQMFSWHESITLPDPITINFTRNL